MVAVAKKKLADDETRSVTFRINEDSLWEALKSWMSAQRVPPNKTDIMTVALQEFLRAEGYYAGDKAE